MLGQPEGLERLGGIDFDEALFRRALDVAKAGGATLDQNDPSTMAAIARLRDECRRAKEALSSDTDATIPIFLRASRPRCGSRGPSSRTWSGRGYETIAALGRATRSAGLEYGDIDRILLVGGSSRIPLVAEMVRDATGRPVAVDAHPKHTMALGAAYVAERQREATAGGAAAAAAGGAGLAAGTPLPDHEPEPEAEPVAATPISGGSDGVRARRMLPIGLALVAVAAVATIAIAANMFGGSEGVPHRPHPWHRPWRSSPASRRRSPSRALRRRPCPAPRPARTDRHTGADTHTDTGRASGAHQQDHRERRPLCRRLRRLQLRSGAARAACALLLRHRAAR